MKGAKINDRPRLADAPCAFLHVHMCGVRVQLKKNKKNNIYIYIHAYYILSSRRKQFSHESSSTKILVLHSKTVTYIR